MKLAVEMDPHNVDAFTVGGYWLQQVGKPGEAEAFLREGQRSNPDSAEIYFELARLHETEGDRFAAARRLYVIALEKWQRANDGVAEPETLALAQILGHLGRLEEQQGELEAALHYYRLLERVSVNPEAVARLVDGVEQRLKDTRPPTGSL